MCRLMAITASEESLGGYKNKQALLHEMLLRGNADGQQDGWGVSDGSYIMKSGDPYWKTVPAWINQMSGGSTWIGHVRSASAGTEKSAHASHPYRVMKDLSSQNIEDTLFIAAHNGMFQGTWTKHDKIDGEPNTDSWRAFVALQKVLLKGEEITADVVDTWLSRFDSDSSFCVLISKGTNLYAIRGDNALKVLHGCTIGDGYIIHTSAEALEAVKVYADVSLGLTTGKVEEIGKKTMVTFQYASPDIAVETLKFVQVSPNYSRNYSNMGYSQTSYVTPPPAERKGRWVRIYSRDAEDVGSENFLKRGIWGNIRNQVEPFRQGLVEVLMAEHFGLETEEGFPWFSWEDYSLEQLIEFLNHIKANPFSEAQKDLVELWNTKVDPCYDVEHLAYQFGEIPFWLMPGAERSIREMSLRRVQ